MTHENLTGAAEALRAAAGAATDGGIADRLDEQAEAMETLAAEDPDHGRMARHEIKLHELAEEGGVEVADHVEDALERIHAYRETVEGV